MIANSSIKKKEISTRKGGIILVQLAKKGTHLLRELGYDMENRIRKYGLLHEFWKDKVKRYYQKLGYKVTSEENLKGERVDLVAERVLVIKSEKFE